MKIKLLKRISSILMLLMIIGQINVPLLMNADELFVYSIAEGESQKEKSDDEMISDETTLQSSDNEVNSASSEDVHLTTLDGIEEQINDNENETIYYVINNNEYKALKSSYHVDKHAHPTLDIDDFSTTRYGDLMYYVVNGDIVFCIEPTKDVLSNANSQTENENAYSTLPITTKDKIAQYISFGTDLYNQTGNEDYLYATQLLIWNEIDPGKYNIDNGTSLQSEIDSIRAEVNNYSIIPSFMATEVSSAPIHTLYYNPNTSKYETILTDTNHVYDEKYKINNGNYGDYKVTNLGNNKVKIETSNNNASNNTLNATYTPYGSSNNSFFDAGQDLINVGAKPVKGYLKLKIAPAVADFTINKKGEVLVNGDTTKVPLADVEFKITNTTTGESWTKKTDSNGKINLNDVMAGTFEVCEIQTVNGYVLNPVCKTYTVKPGEDKQVTIYNDVIKGSAHLNKVGESLINGDNKVSPLAGVKFKVEGITDPNFNRVYTTDSNGDIYINGLKYGKYKITEIETINGYVLGNYSEEFEINQEGEVVELNGGNRLENKVIKGQVDLTKVMSTMCDKSLNKPGEIKECQTLLGNVSFAIYADINNNGVIDKGEDKEVEVITTNEYGYAQSGDLKYGNYLIKEINAPENIVVSDKTYAFSITEDDRVVHVNNGIVIENEQKLGQFQLQKVDNYNEPISGVTFGIYADLNNNGMIDETEENELELLITDESGHATSKLLPFGNYIVKELDAPENVIMSSEEYPVVINNETYKEMQVVKVVNEVISNEIHIKKVDAITGKQVAGAHLQIVNLANNEVVDEWISDGSKHIVSLDYGEYEIVEKAAPDNYELLSEPIKFSVKDEGKIQTINVENKLICDPTKSDTELKELGCIKEEYEILITGNSILCFLIVLAVLTFGLVVVKRKVMK